MHTQKLIASKIYNKLSSLPTHPHTHVTQFTTNLTAVICNDSSGWQHTIRNACQDHTLSHLLHNPATIFNIHHNVHNTTLIIDNTSYYYYDSLNYNPPQATSRIHNTLRQWYSALPITTPLLHPNILHIILKSTSRQTDGWSCGMHMLLVNLTTIYQGSISNIKHTQQHVHDLSRIHLRYVVMGELDE